MIKNKDKQRAILQLEINGKDKKIESTDNGDLYCMQRVLALLTSCKNQRELLESGVISQDKIFHDRIGYFMKN